MTLARHWRRTGRPRGYLAAGRAARAACAALPLLLGACTAVPDWADPSRWGSSDVDTSDLASPAPADGFPNLASVPNTAPKAMAPATQAEIRESLAADRANAEYTSQKLKAAADTSKLAASDPGKVLPVPAAEPAAPQPEQSAFRFPQFEPGAAAPAPAPARSDLVGVIYFGYGSTALSVRDQDILRDVVALQQQRGGTIRVIGHASARTGVADSVRHRLANFETSLKRANTVAKALVALGAVRDKVAAEARGDAQPVYHEFMPTGEAGNRRAEIFLEN